MNLWNLQENIFWLAAQIVSVHLLSEVRKASEQRCEENRHVTSQVWSPAGRRADVLQRRVTELRCERHLFVKSFEQKGRLWLFQIYISKTKLHVTGAFYFKKEKHLCIYRRADEELQPNLKVLTDVVWIFAKLFYQDCKFKWAMPQFNKPAPVTLSNTWSCSGLPAMQWMRQSWALLINGGGDVDWTYLCRNNYFVFILLK